VFSPSWQPWRLYAWILADREGRGDIEILGVLNQDKKGFRTITFWENRVFGDKTKIRREGLAVTTAENDGQYLIPHPIKQFENVAWARSFVSRHCWNGTCLFPR
jgi:hypothetical protein